MIFSLRCYHVFKQNPLNMRNIIEENLTYGHVNEFIKEIKTMLKRIIIIHYIINTNLT